jgi:hypothetical protein
MKGAISKKVRLGGVTVKAIVRVEIIEEDVGDGNEAINEFELWSLDVWVDQVQQPREEFYSADRALSKFEEWVQIPVLS